MRHIHTSIVSMHIATRGNNKILTRRTFAQPRTNKSPFILHTYTKATPKHIHHHYAPSVTSTHTTHILWFCDGEYVSQPPYVWYYVAVKSNFKHVCEECESKRAYVFRWLIFCLSGPCDLLFLLCIIASWT